MSPIKIILSGSPISSQSIYRATCRGGRAIYYMNKRGKDKLENYKWQIKQQYKGEVLECSLSLEVDLYFGDKRKHDWDNYNKLLDSLQGIVFVDDIQIQEARVRKYYDKEDPRIEIKICSL